MTETGMYLYPWDTGDSLEDFFQDYAKTGCDAMAPALAYHQGSILSARTGRIRKLSKSAVYFTANPSLYGLLKPEIAKETAAQNIIEKMREWCSRTNKRFSGWVVLLHNSSLGEKHPDACVINALGDRLAFSLCPANTEVKNYTSALLEDICSQFSPDSLMLESAAPRAALHGSHHEISNVKIGTAALWLLSLCFCPFCMEAAGKTSGFDPGATRETCALLIKRLLNSETSFPGNDLAQLTTLLLEYPELHAYQLARQKQTAEFIRNISGILRKRSVEFRLIPSSFPYDILCSFIEVLGFRSTAGLADALIPLVYGVGETYALVRNNIRLLDTTTPVGMATTLNPARFQNKNEFLGAITAAAREKPHCAFFYNYSIASTERLSWLPEAVSLLRQ